jgi:hypothetical protein
MLLEMPFDLDEAKNNLKTIDLEKILTLFRKPWKSSELDMNKFSLIQENEEGYHSKLDIIYNDGNYTLRLYYDRLPIASIGFVSEGDFLNVVQIQGTPCTEIGYFNRKFTDADRSQIRSIVQSFYFGHALLTAGTKHVFDMGVEDLRVLSYYHLNPSTSKRESYFNDFCKEESDVVYHSNSAFMTYDLTALTLGFSPMISKRRVPDGISSVNGLSFNIKGFPDRDITYYCMTKEDYINSVVYELNARDIENTALLMSDIYKTLGNFRNKTLHFENNVLVF